MVKTFKSHSNNDHIMLESNKNMNNKGLCFILYCVYNMIKTKIKHNRD